MRARRSGDLAAGDQLAWPHDAGRAHPLAAARLRHTLGDGRRPAGLPPAPGRLSHAGLGRIGGGARNAATLEQHIEEAVHAPDKRAAASLGRRMGAPPPKGPGAGSSRSASPGAGRRRFSAVRPAASNGASRRSKLPAAWAEHRSGSTGRRPTAVAGHAAGRDWRGERHEVHVVENGFIWRGKTRRSLSAIASEIAGGRRNGPAFFGLRDGSADR